MQLGHWEHYQRAPGSVAFNAAMPDGTMRKLLDSGKLHGMGWVPRIEFREGVADAYADFLNAPAVRR